jgi:SAM-dependent methyltransferase
VPGIDYVTADLESGRGDLAMDVTAIPCRDESFDAILCVHVLEHVEDDRNALREFHRVLKPGGWAVVHVPLEEPGHYFGLWRDGAGPPGAYFDAAGRRLATYENPAALTWDDRKYIYGQGDHVRIYGLDYPNRLRNAGFLVSEGGVPEQRDALTRSRYGLTGERIYFCRKAAGKFPRPPEVKGHDGVS